MPPIGMNPSEVKRRHKGGLSILTVPGNPPKEYDHSSITALKAILAQPWSLCDVCTSTPRIDPWPEEIVNKTRATFRPLARSPESLIIREKCVDVESRSRRRAISQVLPKCSICPTKLLLGGVNGVFFWWRLVNPEVRRGIA